MKPDFPPDSNQIKRGDASGRQVPVARYPKERRTVPLASKA
jgi:hypothetical protein